MTLAATAMMRPSSPNFSVLSEEWVSQPRSSSPSLPNGSRKSLPSASPSRIPRFNSKSMKSAPRHSAPMKPVKPLSLRTENNDNIPYQPSPSGSDPKTTHQSKTSIATQTSYADSVVKHRSLNKAKLTDARPTSDACTPEWKRRLLNTNQNAQADLFGPIGLEGIFTEPMSDPDVSNPHQSLFSIGQGSDYMPSSPPPWPNTDSNSNTTTKSTNIKHSGAPLDILEEEDEDAERFSAVSRIPRHNDVAKPPPTDNLQTKIQTSLDRSNEDKSAPADPKFSSSSISSAKNAVSQKHRSSSSIANDFSPVFISKHNTVDGRVDYAAVDPSDPQMAIQLRQRAASQALHSHPVPQSGVQEQPTASSRLSGTSNDSQNLRSLNEHVTCERGSQLDPNTGSFRRKPLSPSASSSFLPTESLAPSDSMSQTCLNANGQRVHVRDLRAADIQYLNEPQQNHNRIEDARNKVEKLLSKYKEGMLKPTIHTSPLAENIPLPESASPTDELSMKQHQHYDSALMAEEAKREHDVTVSAVDDKDSNRQPDQSENDPALLGAEAASKANQSRESSSQSHITAIQNPPAQEHGTPKGTAPKLDATANDAKNMAQDPVPNAQAMPQHNDHDSQPSESSTGVQFQAHIQAIIGRKRKDARYDDSLEKVDPSALAKREILRPRNSTPGQGLRDGSATTATHDYDRFSEVPWNHSVDSPHVLERPDSDTAAKARALASEVATLRTETQGNPPTGTRKNSVSTQDYVDEAMKIMELIRRKKSSGTWMGVPGSEGPGDESQWNTTEPTPPPSPPRLDEENPKNAWRGRDDKPLNPRVLSHLKKYEETGDESFLVSSIARSVKASEQLATQHQQGNVRITESQNHSQERRHSDSEIQLPQRDFDENRVKSHSSNGSSNSTGRTLRTDSSQRARNVAVISPDRVPHLLGTEQAGMRFDTERHSWVRCKGRKSPVKQDGALGSSSAGTDEDPLGQIPDLSISGMSNRNNGYETYDMTDQSKEDPPGGQKLQNSEHGSIRRDQAPNMDSLPERPHSARSSSGQKSSQTLVQYEMQRDSDHSDSTEELHYPGYNGYPDDDATPSVSAEGEPPMQLFGFRKRPISHLPTDTVKSSRRDQAVLFSSPPVSREYDSKVWEHSDISGEGVDSTEGELLPQNEADLTEIRRRPSHASTSERTRNGSVIRHPDHARWFDQSTSLSLSRVDEHHEISFSQTKPDGRTMSLSLSVSTPHPRQNRTPNKAIVSSGQRTNNYLPHLSPLSEFTINQNDERHFRSQHLDKAANVKLLPNHKGAYVESALATNDLVTKLTDAEPNEPDWEKTRTLSLEDKQIDSVHMLDELCPNLEQLDASSNNLMHVVGVPWSVRDLNVSDNRLSSFTEWSHLPDLQYLDASNNELDNLDALRSQKHLRELKVNNNKVSNLNGILQLDGLLDLSLKNNKMTSVSFEGAQLKRLTSLDLSHNDLNEVNGLEHLPSLERLDLTGNNLKHLRLATTKTIHPKLKSLRLDKNMLRRLDVSMFPNLEELFINENRVTSLTLIKYHKKMKTLEFRNQRLTPGQYINLHDFRNLTHVYLSGTSLPPTLLTPNARESPFLNLQTLDVSFTGLQSLPENMGMLMPNMRTVNLNANSIKDLQPLKGMVGLQKLYAAGNRVTRLRKLARVLASLAGLCGGVLEEVDLRGNPVACGFYPASKSGSEKHEGGRTGGHLNLEIEGLGHLLAAGDADRDELYEGRLDEDTKLRRRVYELLLATKCKSLEKVDGLEFDREGTVNRRDGVWRKLREMGVLEEKY